MVTESEGYETIRKARMKETERQLNEVIAQKDKCVEAQTGHILYNKTEIARSFRERNQGAEMSKISQPFDEKIKDSCFVAEIKDCLKEVVITLENGDIEDAIHDLREIIKDIER